jgi:hypothetical protein
MEKKQDSLAPLEEGGYNDFVGDARWMSRAFSNRIRPLLGRAPSKSNPNKINKER